MGKYMRKCRGAMGEGVAAVEVTQVVGVRTRSRSASASAARVASSKRRKAALPPAPAVGLAGDSSVGSRGDGDSGSCYLKLRSRMLFMAPPAARAEAAGSGAQQGAVLAGGLSRCSSTASSVDVSASQDKGLPCHPKAAKASGDHIPEVGSASNSESGRDRERRETTPSSHHPAELSDLESDLAGPNSSRPLPAIRTTVQQAARPAVPPAAEIEQFFAAAEEAEAKRFASKYNFDVVRGVPLDGGRFEWTPAASSS